MHTVSAAAAAASPDTELARRVIAGDHAAFAQLMRRYNRLLYRTARAILKDDAEAEDALQDGYLLAFRAIANFRGEAKLSSWLVRIVANEALRRLRKRARAAEVTYLGESSRDEPERAATVRSRYFRAKGLVREALASEIDAAFEDAFGFDGARCDRMVAAVMARLEVP